MLRLKRIVIFVSDLEKQTIYYRDALGLGVIEERSGWIEFDTGGTPIALHRGAGRKPRLDFETDGDLVEARQELNERGAKLGAIGSVGDVEHCCGKDRDGHSIQIERRRPS